LDRCCLRMKLRFECIIWTIECQSCWLSMYHWYFIWLKQRDEWWWVIAVTWRMWHRWLTIFLSPEFHQGRNMTLVLLGPRWDRDGQLNWERHQEDPWWHRHIFPGVGRHQGETDKKKMPSVDLYALSYSGRGAADPLSPSHTHTHTHTLTHSHTLSSPLQQQHKDCL